MKTKGNEKPVVPEKPLGKTGCLFSNGGGLAAFQKFSLPSADTSKALYLQSVESFQVPFSASRYGKYFSPHFVPRSAVASLRDSPAARVPFASQAVIPKQRMDVGSIPTAISNAVIS